MNRILLHIPHGVLAALSSKSLEWTAAFLVYELNQDRHIEDSAHEDIEGFLVGMFIGEAGKRIWKKLKR